VCDSNCGKDKVSPRWSPDGKEVLYIRSAPDGVAFEIVNIRTKITRSLPIKDFENVPLRDVDWR